MIIIKKVFKVLKSIICSILFFVILFNILVETSYFFRPKDENIDTITGYYEQEEDSLDAVFIGTSTVYRLYIPSLAWNEYGYTSFGYASSSMPFEAVPYILKEVDRTQNPKVVVIDTRNLVKITSFLLRDEIKPNVARSLNRTRTFINCVTNNMPYNRNRVELIHSYLPEKMPEEDELYWQLDLLGNHKNWKEKSASDYFKYISAYIKGEKNTAEAVSENLATQCIETRFRSKKQTRWEPSKEEKKQKTVIPEEYLKPIDEIMEYSKENNIEILFVSSPYSTNLEYFKVENYLIDYVKEKGFNYLNCNEYYDEIGLNFDTDFEDYLHTNILGSEKYTKFIGKYLTENYNLDANKHDDETVEYYNNSYKEYLKITTDKKNALKAKLNIK